MVRQLVQLTWVIGRVPAYEFSQIRSPRVAVQSAAAVRDIHSDLQRAKRRADVSRAAAPSRAACDRKDDRNLNLSCFPRAKREGFLDNTLGAGPG
jgi:hypothetical protein